MVRIFVWVDKALGIKPEVRSRIRYEWKLFVSTALNIEFENVHVIWQEGEFDSDHRVQVHIQIYGSTEDPLWQEKASFIANGLLGSTSSASFIEHILVSVEVVQNTKYVKP